MNRMIPSELLHADENGNAVIGKNLDVTGTTRLNGGIEAIHNYKILNGNYKLIVLFEKYDSINEEYCAFGFIEDGNTIHPGFFQYAIFNGAVDYFYGVFEDTIYQLQDGSITKSAISTTSI